MVIVENLLQKMCASDSRAAGEDEGRDGERCVNLMAASQLFEAYIFCRRTLRPRPRSGYHIHTSFPQHPNPVIPEKGQVLREQNLGPLSGTPLSRRCVGIESGVPARAFTSLRLGWNDDKW